MTATRVADVADHRQVVRDEEVGEAELLLQVGQQVDDLRLDGHVERRHRLVADDQLGPERERARHADALALTAGELGREPVVVLRVEPDEFHDLLDPLLALLSAGDAVDRERVADDRPDPAARVEGPVRVLENHLHVPAVRAHAATGQRADVVAVERDLPGGEVVQPHDAAGQRGLAAAGLADQAEGLPAADLETDSLHGVHEVALPPEELAGAHREVLDDVLDAQQDVIVARRADHRLVAHDWLPVVSAGAARASADAAARSAGLGRARPMTSLRRALRAGMSCGSQQADR